MCQSSLAFSRKKAGPKIAKAEFQYYVYYIMSAKRKDIVIKREKKLNCFVYYVGFVNMC